VRRIQEMWRFQLADNYGCNREVNLVRKSLREQCGMNGASTLVSIQPVRMAGVIVGRPIGVPVMCAVLGGVRSGRRG